MSEEALGTPATADVEAPDTLGADLSAAFEADEKAQEPNPVSEAARTLAGARKKAAEKVEATEPVGTEQKAPVIDPKAPVDPKPVTEPEAIEAPAHWAQADRELFAKQAPETQKWMLARHKAMEGDYTRRVGELNPTKRIKETIDEVFAPYREAMARDGLDESTAIRQLVAAHDYLQRDPGKAIHWLAQKYGIDLQQAVAGGGTDAQPNPEMAAVMQRQAQLEKQLTSALSAQQQEKHQASLAQVEQFAGEKDAQGKALRPHFEEVSKDISYLLKASRDAGEMLSLQDAYDRAVYANPQTRAKVLAAQEAERQVKAEEERKRKADSAKRAGFEVQGQGAAVPMAAQTNSLRADLEAAYAGDSRV